MVIQENKGDHMSQKKKRKIVKIVIPISIILFFSAAIIIFTSHINKSGPFAFIPYDGKFLVTDNNGYILKQVNSLDSYVLPQIKGLKFKDYEVGKAIKFDSKDAFNDAKIIISTMKENDLKHEPKMQQLVKVIDVNDLNSVILEIDMRIAVNMGNPNDPQHSLENKITTLKSIYNNYIKKDEKGKLDLSYRTSPPNFKHED